MESSANLSLSSDMQKHAAEAELFLKQFANARRLLVLCQLSQGEKTAGELLKHTGLSHSALSQHLAKMRECGLVDSKKMGKNVVYRLANIQVQALLSVLHLMFCANTK